MSSPRSGEKRLLSGPALPAFAPAGRSLAFSRSHGVKPARESGTHGNSLFCQRPVQKVEPILSPEQLVAVNVRGRAEHLARDRFAGERLVPPGNRLAGRAFRQRSGIESQRLGDVDEGGLRRYVALIVPEGAPDRARQGERLPGIPLFRGENPVRRPISVGGKIAWLAIQRDAEMLRPALELDQAVRLALRRALRQRQSSRHRK